MATVVDFAEGILGFGWAKYKVAEALRVAGNNQDRETYLKMFSLAVALDLDKSVTLAMIQDIGEKPLAETQRFFLHG